MKPDINKYPIGNIGPLFPWRTDKPEPNRVVEAWHYNHVELATRDGDAWRTLSGAPLLGVTHWRERTPDQVTA